MTNSDENGKLLVNMSFMSNQCFIARSNAFGKCVVDSCPNAKFSIDENENTINKVIIIPYTFFIVLTSSLNIYYNVVY